MALWTRKRQSTPDILPVSAPQDDWRERNLAALASIPEAQQLYSPDPRSITLAHITHRQAVENIFEKGFSPYLISMGLIGAMTARLARPGYEVALQWYDAADSTNAAAEMNAGVLSNYHRGYDQVVIMQLPDPLTDADYGTFNPYDAMGDTVWADFIHRANLLNAMATVALDEQYIDSEGMQIAIPTELVYGAVDRTNAQFVPNPAWAGQ